MAETSCPFRLAFRPHASAHGVGSRQSGLQLRRYSGYNLRLFPSSDIFGNTMVVIRLARGGAKKRPFYNIVATDSRNRRDGRFIERIGFYNPVAAGAEESVRVAQDRLAYWQGVGAQLSPTVSRLISEAGKKAAA
jgi:small subunit ribosomal protein S16